MCPSDAPSGHISRPSPADNWEIAPLSPAPLTLQTSPAASTDYKEVTAFAVVREPAAERLDHSLWSALAHLCQQAFTNAGETCTAEDEILDWYLARANPTGEPPISERAQVVLVGRNGVQPAVLVKSRSAFLRGDAGDDCAASERPILGVPDETQGLFVDIRNWSLRVAGILIADSVEKDTDSADGALDADTNVISLPDGSYPVYVIVTSGKYKGEPKTTNALGERAHAPVPDRLCVTPAFSTPMHPDPSDVGRQLAELLEQPVNASRVATHEYEVRPEPKDPSERVELCPSGLSVEEID